MRRLVVTAAMTAALLLPLTGSAIEAAGMTVKFTSFRTPVKRGSSASASIHTGANAYCKLKVAYASGTASIGGKYTNGSGNASWTWKVPGSTQPGTFPVTVTCQSGSHSGKATKYLQVTN